jgi:excisionase family DNA binding protein
MTRRRKPAAIHTAAHVIMSLSGQKTTVAQYLKLKPKTVYQLMRRRSPRPLPYLKCGKYLRFLKSDIDAWLLASRVN